MIPQLIFLVSAMSALSVAGHPYPSPARQHVKLVPESVKSSTFEVQTESGKVWVERRILDVQMETANHQTVTENVLMFYDPRSKLFWWAHSLPLQHQPLPKNAVMFLTNSKFIMFWNGWVSTGKMVILESSDRFSSIDEGQEKALRTIEDHHVDVEGGKFLQEYKRIDLTLNSDFRFEKNVANLVGPTLEAVSRVGSEWHIVEDGPNGGCAVIVLNDNYEVLSVKVQPAK